jgi:hypothetical protein
VRTEEQERQADGSRGGVRRITTLLPQARGREEDRDANRHPTSRAASRGYAISLLEHVFSGCVRWLCELTVSTLQELSVFSRFGGLRLVEGLGFRGGRPRAIKCVGFDWLVQGRPQDKSCAGQSCCTRWPHNRGDKGLRHVTGSARV